MGLVLPSSPSTFSNGAHMGWSRHDPFPIQPQRGLQLRHAQIPIWYFGLPGTDDHTITYNIHQRGQTIKLTTINMWSVTGYACRSREQMPHGRVAGNRMLGRHEGPSPLFCLLPLIPSWRGTTYYIEVSVGLSLFSLSGFCRFCRFCVFYGFDNINSSLLILKMQVKLFNAKDKRSDNN